MAIDGIIFERVKNMGLEFIFLFPYILYLWIHILELFIELYADINKKLHLLNYWCYRIIKSVNTEYEVNEDLSVSMEYRLSIFRSMITINIKNAIIPLHNRNISAAAAMNLLSYLNIYVAIKKLYEDLRYYNNEGAKLFYYDYSNELDNFLSSELEDISNTIKRIDEIYGRTRH